MKVDLPSVRATIDAHPWKSVTLAFLVGAYLGLPGGRRAFAGTLAAVAVSVVRELAREQLARRTRSWVDQKVRPHAVA